MADGTSTTREARLQRPDHEGGRVVLWPTDPPTDRLTFVLGIAVREKLVFGSEEHRAIAEILSDLGESLGVSR